MENYYADLHIHVGISADGQWVKIPTSRQLTVKNICNHAARQKGLHLIGLVDALSPLVLQDLQQLYIEGLLVPLSGGGYQYDHHLTVLLGAEIETREIQGGMCHTIIFLPDITAMHSFAEYMKMFIANIHLSTQNARMPLSQLVKIAADFEAIIIPAHIFTPYKSIYGSSARRLSQLLPDKLMAKISAVELGLSADSSMADRISELASFTFLTNSDAHSPAKIGREYNLITLQQPSFHEFLLALEGREGRGVTVNYGLDPRLGKYHRTCCKMCGHTMPNGLKDNCVFCGSRHVVKGVFDRIVEIADYDEPVHPCKRPCYHYQIPLEFISGIGQQTLGKLLRQFGTEMNVLHKARYDHLQMAIGPKIASAIVAARTGAVMVRSGGGGRYGKII